MKIHVLGSAAGGGFPQWNCNCRNCDDWRKGATRAEARTQSSIAVSIDGENWLLVNASPDIRSQILATPALQPARAVRDSGIAAVLLMDSQIDHVTGLIMLRESNTPLSVYCTDRVREDLETGFPIFKILSHYSGVTPNRIDLQAQSFEPAEVPGLRIHSVPLLSKAPPYSPHRADPQPGDNIGVLFEEIATGKTAFYAPGLGIIEDHLTPYMERADVLLVDGTCWREDEMAREVGGEKTAAEMGHRVQSGPGGMIEVLEGFPNARRILIHINNTNPILNPDSDERRILDEAGLEVSYDGLGIEL